jgi:4-amino-4-deoxy-L-arabinose transferase-like glycosyltransferase
MRRHIDRPITALAGIVLVLIAQLRFTRTSQPPHSVAIWMTGLVLMVLWARTTSGRSVVAPVDGPRPPLAGWRHPRTLVPAAIAVSACIACWRLQHQGGPESDRWGSIPVWTVGLIGALLAVWQPPAGRSDHAVRAWWRRRRGEVAVLCACAAAAAIATMVHLGSMPWTFNGDEGGFAVLSNKMLDGEVPNPFGVGYMAHPLLYNAMQSAAMHVAGRTVLGARLVSAVLGALSVPLAYLVAKRLGGNRATGLVAAALLATFHVHLYWSRSALPNGASVFFVLLVLYLIDRTTTDRGPAVLVATGISAGLAQYFYFSNRILPIVLTAALIAGAIASVRADHRLGIAIGALAQRGALMAAGFVAAVIPLAAFYDVHPEQFDARVDQVSLLHSGAIGVEAAATGRSTLGVVWHHLMQSAMLPFRTQPAGFYRGAVPFIGWPMAVTAAIGMALALSRVLQPRWTGLSAAYWATVIGMALTTGPADTNRWVMAVPLVCVFAALGVGVLARAAVAALPGSQRVVVVVAALAVAATCVSSLHVFFHDDNQPDLYSDTNTQVAEHMARQIDAIDPNATVYFSGSPRMSYAGFNDLVFRTPHVISVDVTEPWNVAAVPPQLVGWTVFVVLPERSDDLAVVQGWFPGGVRSDTLADDRSVLYSSYVVGPAGGTVTDDGGSAGG